MELTSARYRSVCLIDLHKDAKLSLGNDTNLFSCRDFKRYNPSKDQSLFGPVKRLPIYILESIGLSNLQLADHIVDTSGIAPYRSTPPIPPQLTEIQVPHPKPKGSNPWLSNPLL